MGRRPLVGAVQLAAFVGGGVLGPVAHLAWHRPDHSHGPGGTGIAFDLSRATSHRAREPSLEHAVEDSNPRHHHAHSHAHPHAHTPPAGAAAAPGSSARGNASPEPAATGVPPADPGHGHASLAHLGLALLSAPPLLALSAPGPVGVLPPGAPPHPDTLHRPTFPLPRPPPFSASS